MVLFKDMDSDFNSDTYYKKATFHFDSVLRLNCGIVAGLRLMPCMAYAKLLIY